MKKNIIYIVCAAIVVIALTAMLIFIFSDKTPDAPEPSSAFSGTWEVVALVQGGTPTLLDDEFMVFDETRAACYRGGVTEPYAASAYSISGGNTLELPDISRKYIIDQKTENLIYLYETPEKALVLVRYKNADMSPVAVNEADLLGKWNVTYRPAEQKMEEILEFTADTLNDYRNGATEPSATSAYHWEDGKNVFADAWNKEFEYHVLSEDVIYFVEVDTGIVWELHRIK